MSLNLVRAVVRLDEDDYGHLARLLILLRATDHRRNNVEGITKLAKLDFLLRYPNCLERVLNTLRIDAEAAAVQPYERTTIETKMIRFRYGPWDGRYRRWIGLLVARGLATTYVLGKTVHVAITPQGQQTADQLGDLDEFRDYKQRSQMIDKAVGPYTATKLKNFIYEVFPELTAMTWGEEIVL